jgi:transcription elongation GreA/GreB family factor
MIQPIQPLQHGFLDDDAKQAHQQRCQQQHHPVIDAEILQSHPRKECTHHVQRTMGKIDHIEQTENHRQTQRQHRIERTIDQSQQ